MDVLLQNVRCFCDAQTITIRPLTLLVGENSTGKSTFLAMLAHVSQPNFPLTRPTFNEEPFDLGSFDSIATFKGGRYGRADSFSIGFSEEGVKRLLATYESYKGQPTLSKLLGSTKDLQVVMSLDQQNATVQIDLDYRDKHHRITSNIKAPLESGLPVGFLVYGSVGQYFSDAKDPESAAAASQVLYELLPPLSSTPVTPAFAMSPVRTKPRRTYDEISDEFQPEGQHIPIQLARLWQDEAGSARAHLTDELSEFGIKSSLFRKIGVKRLGKRPSDPFQILVTTEGPPVNLSDVGYGVSQALPVIVESVLSSKRRRLLLQQPEVHLHPRGQAALGSFFAHLVAAEQKNFVIETHSDYILDRIRTEVAQGKLSAESVSILFFEKLGLETRIHHITVDKDGNITGAPDSYRRFFADEELIVMSRASK